MAFTYDVTQAQVLDEEALHNLVAQAQVRDEEVPHEFAEHTQVHDEEVRTNRLHKLRYMKKKYTSSCTGAA